MKLIFDTRFLLFFAAALVVLLPSTAFSDSGPDSNLLLGGTAYFENSRMEGEQNISVQDEDQSFDYKNSNHFSTRLVYLRPFTETIYFGGGFDFIGTYRGVLQDDEDEEPDPEEPPEYYEFGPLLEALAFGEWRLPLGEDFGLALGTQLGLGMLFPRGDLASEIRELQNQDVGVWDTPRFGVSAGAYAAFYLKIDDRMAIRTEAGLQSQKILLFRTSETIDDVAFSKNWTTGTTRTRLGISLQFTL